MKRIFTGILTLFTSSLALTASPQKEFKRETIEFTFSEIRKQTDWNLDAPLIWGFFFISATKLPLVEASKALEKMGYRVVSIRFEEEEKEWWLHVEKVGVHSVDSLHAQNQRFVKFAAEMKLGTYDGWDVGPVLDAKKG